MITFVATHTAYINILQYWLWLHRLVVTFKSLYIIELGQYFDCDTCASHLSIGAKEIICCAHCCDYLGQTIGRRLGTLTLDE